MKSIPRRQSQVKPELTMRRAWAHILRRWWLLPLCMVLVTIAALSLASVHFSNAKAVQRVHVQDTTVSYQFQGVPQPFTPPRSVTDLTASDFVDPQVANQAAAKLHDGTTGPQLINGLGFAALTGSDVQLSYSDSGSSQDVQRRLEVYVRTLIQERIAAERHQLLQAANSLQSHNGDQSAIARLQTAAGSLSQQIHPVTAVSTTNAKTVPKPALVAAGLLAGVILGVLIALAWGQADGRIRGLADLRAAGVRAVAVEPGKTETVEALRALSEVGGVGTGGGVVAIVTPRGDHGEALSRTLAEAFAHTGRPVTWLSDRGARRSAGGTWTAVDAGPGVLDSLPALQRELDGAPSDGVAVIDAPALLERPGNIVASAVATITIVSLRRGKSTWDDLESTLELLDEAVSAGRVRICLDGTRSGMLQPALARSAARREQPA
jgi:hypothetical protein